MTILSELFGKRATTEGPYRLADDGSLSLFASGPNTTSGIYVDEQTSMSLSAVYACVKIIAESLSSLPLILYRREGEDERIRDIDHPLYPILHDTPNPMMTSMIWRETMAAHLLLWGNHYSVIRRSGNDVTALEPLHPLFVTPEEVPSKSGRMPEIIYRVRRNSGPELIYRRQEMFHVPGLSFNGLVGMSVIAAQREAVSLGIALARYGSTFFGNGAKPGGIITVPAVLKPEQKKKMRESWDEQHQGTRNWNKLAILDGDLKYQPISVNPDDAQFLESRKFAVEEIARMFRVPLVMLQSQEKTTSWGSGVEQLMIGFVTGALRPIMVRIEQTVHQKLLSEPDKKTHYVEHLDAALLRGDLKSRYEAYALGRQNGWLSRNDVRKVENMPPIDDELGDSYAEPANIAGKAPSADQGNAAPANSEPADSKDTSKQVNSLFLKPFIVRMLRPVVRRQVDLVVSREVSALRKALETKEIGEFLPWAEEYYLKYRDFVQDSVGPALESVAGGLEIVDSRTWCSEQVSRIAVESHTAIVRTASESVDKAIDAKSAVRMLVEAWATCKTDQMVNDIFGAAEVEA